MADYANQNQVIGINIKEGFGGIHYPRPMWIVHVKCMLAITTVSEIKNYFTHKLAFYYEIQSKRSVVMSGSVYG